MKLLDLSGNASAQIYPLAVYCIETRTTVPVPPVKFHYLALTVNRKTRLSKESRTAHQYQTTTSNLQAPQSRLTSVANVVYHLDVMIGPFSFCAGSVGTTLQSTLSVHYP